MNLVLLTAMVAIVLFMSQARGDAIVTDSTSNSSVQSKSDSTTTVKSPPPSAIAPSMGSMNSDLCTFGFSGAVQTQVLGVSTGGVFTDENCERLKLAKTLFDTGMKVAAVSVLCQDKRVFDAMESAGTPCPAQGKIGTEAKAIWDAKPEAKPKPKSEQPQDTITYKQLMYGLGSILLIGLLL